MLGPEAYVQCQGKGRKLRNTPLRKGTITVLRTWIAEPQGVAWDDMRLWRVLREQANRPVGGDAAPPLWGFRAAVPPILARSRSFVRSSGHSRRGTAEPRTLLSSRHRTHFRTVTVGAIFALLDGRNDRLMARQRGCDYDASQYS